MSLESKNPKIETMRFSLSGNNYYNTHEDGCFQGDDEKKPYYSRIDAVPREVPEYKHTPQGNPYELRRDEDGVYPNKKIDVTIRDEGYSGGLKPWKPQGRKN